MGNRDDHESLRQPQSLAAPTTTSVITSTVLAPELRRGSQMSLRLYLFPH